MACPRYFSLFASIKDYKLYQTFSQSNTHHDKSCDNNYPKTCSALKPLKNLSNLSNEFNNYSSKQNKDSDNPMNYQYNNTDEIQTLNKHNHKGALYLFHINTCSRPKNIEDLEYLMDKTKINFNVAAIIESRIFKNWSSISDINLRNYLYELCPTEYSSGGTFLYIINHLSYKPRANL